MTLHRLIIAAITAAVLTGTPPAGAQTPPFTLAHTFDDPTVTIGDNFGNSVSVSENHILIGAPNDSTNEFSSGQAYLFNAITGALIRTFNTPIPMAGERFGWSVSVSGDNVLIGAGGGQAHLFSASTGALLQTFNAPAPTAVDRFGWSVSVSGDNVLIGAPGNATNGFGVGQVYLFSATTGVLLQTFDDPTPTTSDWFGSSVSVSGNNVLIGAPRDDTNGAGVGQAHLFSATTGLLLQTYDDPTPRTGDQFGGSVSVSEDKSLIGAIGDYTNAINVDQAYLFSTTTGLLLQTFNDPTPTTDDVFGFSVSLSGDNVLIGAFGDDTKGNNVGQAHLFSATTGFLLQTFDDPTPANDDHFGYSVSVSSDNVLIGAFYDDTSGENVGQAHLFRIETTVGALTGIYTAFGACTNVTTNQFVIATVNADHASWDCEAAGLTTNEGDTMAAIGIGVAQPVLGTVGGSLTSASVIGAMCRNLTLSQQVFAPVLADGKSWNCEAAGLPVNQGDIVLVIGIGTAN